MDRVRAVLTDLAARPKLWQQLALAFVLVALAKLVDPHMVGLAPFLLAGPVTKSSLQDELDSIMEEAKKIQDRYDEPDAKTGKRKVWTKEDRTKFDDLCKEASNLQGDLEREEKWQRMQDRQAHLREVPEPSLPGSRNPVKDGGQSGAREVAGYVSLGDAVLASSEFRKFAGNDYARGNHAVVQVSGAILGRNSLRGPHGEPLVPLTREGRKVFTDFLESKEMKAVPVLGTGVIEPERLTRLPQVTADERLRIRDIINTGQTGSSGVEYVREESASNNAAPTAHGVEKPEEDVEYSLQTAPVRTIAGWMPVQNQQLEDWAQLRGLIDNRLRYSVQRTEEQQIIWGNGTPPNIEGILDVAGTQNIATNGRYDPGGEGHTLIDAIRMGMTDVRVSGYEPNGVVLHPYDWETVVLTKGTDDRYVWAVIPDDNGLRIWGVRAVESIGARNRDDGRRELIVGDWQMGAQLLDRMQLTVQVGLVDRQFIENMRTILAEERIALAIYAPKAFAHLQTAAAES